MQTHSGQEPLHHATDIHMPTGHQLVGYVKKCWGKMHLVRDCKRSVLPSNKAVHNLYKAGKWYVDILSKVK